MTDAIEKPNGSPQGSGDAAWGCRAIAETIERSERATYRLLETGQLKDCVQKIGHMYVGSKKRLRRHVFGED
jgi:hypothetical protein